MQKDKENSLNEIRILASLNHSNIISYKDAFFDKENSCLCIITEYADDGDFEKKIFDQIKLNKLFSEDKIICFIIQIVNGLKCLHDNKIIHRDIKGANIMLFKSGLIKIGDMNVSKVLKEGLLKTQTGTPYYASPEVWNNKNYDFKSDIWSLGCLIYEITTLKPPFRGTSMKNLYDKVTRGIFDPIPKIFSNNLSEIINSMIKIDPKLRPSCDEILKMILIKNENLHPSFPKTYTFDSKNIYHQFKNFYNENHHNYEIKGE